MSDLNLLQRRRSDGTLTLVGSTHSPADEDRVFPQEFDFSFKRLGAGAWPARVEGDKIILEYANAKAVYKIVEQSDPAAAAAGHHAVLESSELFDAPPIDEAKRDALQAGKSEPAASVADSGTPTVESADAEKDDEV